MQHESPFAHKPLLPVAIAVLTGIVLGRYLSARLLFWLTGLVVSVVVSLIVLLDKRVFCKRDLLALVQTKLFRPGNLPNWSTNAIRFVISAGLVKPAISGGLARLLVFMGFVCLAALRYQLTYYYYPANHIITYCNNVAPGSPAIKPGNTQPVGSRVCDYQSVDANTVNGRFITTKTNGNSLIAKSATRDITDSNSLSALQPSGRQLATIRGMIVTKPYLSKPTGGMARFDFLHPVRTVFTLSCTGILVGQQWRDVVGLVRVSIDEACLNLTIHQNVQLDGWLSSYSQPRLRINPGSFYNKFYYRSRRILVGLQVKSADALRILPNRYYESTSNHSNTNSRNPGFIYGIRDMWYNTVVWLHGMQSKLTSFVSDKLTSNLDMHYGANGNSSADNNIMANNKAAGNNTIDTASFVSALLLGQRYRLDNNTYQAFLRTGTIHFLSISGLHVALFVAVVWFLAWLVRLPRWVCGMLSIIALAFYLAVIPLRPPVLRAGIIAATVSVAYIFRRNHNHINILALAVIVALLYRPIDLFSPGFQLSFIVVLALLLFTTAVYRGMPFLCNTNSSTNTDNTDTIADTTDDDANACFDDNANNNISHNSYTSLPDIPPEPLNSLSLIIYAKTVVTLSKKLLRYLICFAWGLMAVSLVAWIASLPVIAWHFHRVSLWAPVSSVLLYPLIVATMLLGLLKIMLTALIPAAGFVLAGLLQWFSGLAVYVVNAFSYLPGCSLSTASPPLWFIIVFYAILLWLAYCLWRCKRHEDILKNTGQAGCTNYATGNRFGNAGNKSCNKINQYAGSHNGSYIGSYTKQYTNQYNSQSNNRYDTEFIYNRNRLRINPYVKISLVIWLAAFFYFLPFSPRTGNCTTRLYQLAIGSGGVTIIQLANNKTILYNAGSLSDFNAGNSVIIPFLRSKGIEQIDALFIPLATISHYNAVLDLCSNFKVTRVYPNVYFPLHNGYAVRYLIGKLNKIKQPIAYIQQGSSWYGAISQPSSPLPHKLPSLLPNPSNPPSLLSLPSSPAMCSIVSLWPPAPQPDKPNLTDSDTCTILRITDTYNSIILCSNIPTKTQEQIVRLLPPAQLNCDIMVLPLHNDLSVANCPLIKSAHPHIIVDTSPLSPGHYQILLQSQWYIDHSYTTYLNNKGNSNNYNNDSNNTGNSNKTSDTNKSNVTNNDSKSDNGNGSNSSSNNNRVDNLANGHTGRGYECINPVVLNPHQQGYIDIEINPRVAVIKTHR